MFPIKDENQESDAIFTSAIEGLIRNRRTGLWFMPKTLIKKREAKGDYSWSKSEKAAKKAADKVAKE